MYQHISPDALITASANVSGQWGSHENGYTILEVIAGPRMSVLLVVGHSDGSTFYVGSTRWSNVITDVSREGALAALKRRVTEDERP